MKIAILSLAVLASVAMAAPAASTAAAFDGNSKCEISAFRPSWTKLNECCLKNMGGSDFDKQKNHLNCRLPIGKEGPMRNTLLL
ncbi:MAG: hypothetical protein JOS17DRAFT_822869 [Linnemannia elongata]|nr:MAG: hypothetical protein JOS17DRAFT_822869 [Linnemannia elongata]